MNYAIDYAPVADSEVIAWENGSDSSHFLLAGVESEESSGKMDFSRKIRKKREGVKVKKGDFLQALTPEDALWSELGGAGDRFCLAAFRKGVQIFRLPCFVASDIQKEQKQNKMGLEPTVEILSRLAQESPDQFYQFREPDVSITEIRMLTRAYWRIQRKIRIPAEARFRSIELDMELLSGDEDKLFVDKYRKILLRASIPEHLLRIERAVKKELADRLEEFPLYQALFGEIRGVGPVTAGLVIGSIINIQRFATLPKLRAYTAYHLVQNGEGEWKTPRRKKGERFPASEWLRQGVFYFVSEMNKQKPDHPWKMMLEARVAYEREKHPDFRQAIVRNRAERWLGQKFLQYVWYTWRRFEGIGESVE